VPTLVIAARDDLFNTLPAAQFAAEAIPNAELVVFEAGGHLLVGRQQQVRAMLGGFLAKAGLTRGQSL
jgi:2-hydroxy-6-oxonona-2,4-dienedioate hydrolase